MWSVVETCLAIVCACVPTLRPLYERAFGNTKTSTTGYSNRQLAHATPVQIDDTENSFGMRTFGSRSAENSYPGKSKTSKSDYQESSLYSLTRLKEDN
jgi:hypothetical protein